MAADEIMQSRDAEQIKEIHEGLKIMAEDVRTSRNLGEEFMSAIDYFETELMLIGSMTEPGPQERARHRKISAILKNNETRLKLMKSGHSLSLKVMKVFNVTPLKLSERLLGVKGLIEGPEAEKAIQAIVLERLQDQQYAEQIYRARIADEFANGTTVKHVAEVTGKSNRYLAAVQKANSINISTMMLEETLRSAVSDKRTLAKGSLDWLKRQEMASGLNKEELNVLDFFLNHKESPNEPLTIDNIKKAVSKPGYSLRNSLISDSLGKRTKMSHMIMGAGLVSAFMGNLPLAGMAGVAYFIPTLLPKQMSTVDFMKEYLLAPKDSMGALDSKIIAFQQTVMERQTELITEKVSEVTESNELVVQSVDADFSELAVSGSNVIAFIAATNRSTPLTLDSPVPLPTKQDRMNAMDMLNVGLFKSVSSSSEISLASVASENSM